MVIGVDLGTTYSVIAVNGRVKVTDGYPEPQYFESCDVSIIPDPYGSYIIPSAVWQDPENPDKMIVGMDAKEATLEGYSPIMFSKRNIGTNIMHLLGDREYSAREIACEILLYIKDVAEQALGERVDQAVITHPAYFDPAMKEETALAAQDAGFKFDADNHLLMEPIAAALSYTRSDSRDPLRMLTYDLGGGTFDVTIMERRKGVVTVKAFGGNRLLGGYNFDRALARWLLQQLRERGVQISLDETNGVDRGKWATLMRVAEDTKIKLAHARTDKMPVKIRQLSVFGDDNGRPIHLQEQITREQYCELIQELLDTTIFGEGGEGETKGCNATLVEAGMSIDQIDEILLVGGSSAGPWVRQTIARVWGRDPQLFEPDLCVAIGAALHGDTLAEGLFSEEFHIELEVPKQSVLDTIRIGGTISSMAKNPVPSNLHVLLASDSGKKLYTDVQDNGKFLFDLIDLNYEAVTQFTLEIGDSDGRKIATYSFQVTHTPEGGLHDIGVLTVLPKPLYIEVVDGMKPIAQEGAMLPAHCELELTRVNEDDTIEIHLFQERDAIGSVLISNVPKEASVGSKVLLELDVTRSNRITGRATAYTRQGAVAAEAQVDIRIPPMQIPEVSTLQNQFDKLENDRKENIDLAPDAVTRLRMQAKGDKLSRQINEALDDPSPDRQEIWMALRQLEQLINPPQDDMEPPLSQFENILLRIREHLSTQTPSSTTQAHTKMVERLAHEGHKAHAQKDRRDWAQINSSLNNLLYRLERPSETGGPRVTQPTPLQKMSMQMNLDQTRQLLRHEESKLPEASLERLQRRVNYLHEDIQKAENAIEQIDDQIDPQAAESQIQLIYHQMVKPIEDKIKMLKYDVKA